MAFWLETLTNVLAQHSLTCYWVTDTDECLRVSVVVQRVRMIRYLRTMMNVPLPKGVGANRDFG
jgi:hypothetical protein